MTFFILFSRHAKTKIISFVFFSIRKRIFNHVVIQFTRGVFAVNVVFILVLDDVVDVKIIEIDEDKRKLVCSIKQTKENPWSKLTDKFNVNDSFETEKDNENYE